MRLITKRKSAAGGHLDFNKPLPYQAEDVQQELKPIVITFKGSLTRDFQLQVFFMNQCPPGPWVPLGPFQIFSKIRGGFCVGNTHGTGGH
jgi:hypothetical protein